MRDLLSKYGVDVSKIHECHRLSIRVEPHNRTPSAEYTMSGPAWHVHARLVERWMYFADFMASCGLSEPQISITTLDDFV